MWVLKLLKLFRLKLDFFSRFKRKSRLRERYDMVCEILMSGVKKCLFFLEDGVVN